jgi:hypothetical protein
LRSAHTFHEEAKVAVLGLHLQKGYLRYAVLEGPRSKPTLLSRGRLVTPDPSAVPALMDWYDSQFHQLIAKFGPRKVSYRLTLTPSKEQLMHSEFPLGVLNLIAHKMTLPISCFTAQSFTASKLALAKGTDLYAECDRVFGLNPPHWDKNQKHAVLAAWFEL